MLCVFFLSLSLHADLIVVDYYNDKAIRMDETTGSSNVFISPASGGLDGPGTVTFGPDGNLYVSSWYNNRILRYNGQTGQFMDTFINHGPSTDLWTMAFGPDNNLYVSEWNTARIWKYNGQTGAYMNVFVSSSEGLDSPNEMQFKDGKLYVVNTYNGTILRYDAQTGQFIDTFIASVGASVTSFDFGADGNIYVGRRGSYKDILKFHGQTGLLMGTFVSSIPGTSDIYDIEFNNDGSMLYVTTSANQVHRYNGLTGQYIDALSFSGQATYMTFTSVPETQSLGLVFLSLIAFLFIRFFHRL